jgi:hypothetical protein
MPEGNKVSIFGMKRKTFSENVGLNEEALANM